MVSKKCCYEKQAYSINSTISSSMSEDGCVRANIDCVEEAPGNAKMILNMKNYCEEYATKDQVDEIKEILGGGQAEVIEEAEEEEEEGIISSAPPNTDKYYC